MAQLRDIEGIKRGSYYTVPLDKIHIDPEFNCRSTTKFDPNSESDRSLIDSVKAQGVIKPIMITSEAVVVDGHRRYYAAVEAKKEGASIEGIPAYQEPKGFSEADRTLMQISANEDDLPFTRLEQAEAIARLNRFGWDEDRILKETGKSKTWLQNIYHLASAPEAVKQHVVNGELSTNAAIALSRDHDDKTASEKADKAVKDAKAKGKKKATESTTKKSKTLKNFLLYVQDNTDTTGEDVAIAINDRLQALKDDEELTGEDWAEVAVLALQASVSTGMKPQAICKLVYGQMDDE